MKRSSSSGPRAPADWPRFRIGQVSRRLGLEPSTLRYWELSFPQLRPFRRRGQRLYRDSDILLLTSIKALLYERGYTIRGAREALDAAAAVSGAQLGPTDPVPAPPQAAGGIEPDAGLIQAAQRELGAIVERLSRSVPPSAMLSAPPNPEGAMSDR